jgi:outer membrane protein OmpA-like peptidoglycan-associated protein
MAAVAMVLALGGCASKTGTGAAVGAGAGAVLGAGAGAVAGGNKGALIGAAVGAAAGAGSGALIGRYMDKQEAALKKNVKAAQIQREGDKLLVKFNSQILFDINEAVLKQSAKDDLSEFARVLRQYQETDLVIEGHTDSTGPRAFNEELSWDRARAVVDFLQGAGVERARMAARGYAATRPVASNDSEPGRRQNRRVQIQIEPNEELQRQDATQAANARQRQQAARSSGAVTR